MTDHPTLSPTDGVATVQGMPFVVPHAERAAVSRRLMATGATEPRFTDVVGRLVQPGHHVLDVGASIGYFTCIMARLAGPHGRVIAFEPVERARAYLGHNVRSNGLTSVIVDDRALADWTGVGYVTLPKYRLEAAVPEGASVAYDTRVARLDDISEELSIGRLHVVKIDIEGSEQRALAGMRSLLDRHRPTLAIEVHPAFLGQFGDSVGSFNAMLANLGYSAVAIDPLDADSNYHIIAAPQERLQELRLLGRGLPERRFALSGATGWGRPRRSSVDLRSDGDALELRYALGDGEKEYIVTADHTTDGRYETFQRALAPPFGLPRYALDGDRYTEVRWNADTESDARCGLWIFEYDRRRLVAKTSIPLTPGSQRVPHICSTEARSFRLGLRVAGRGMVRLNELELIQA